MKEPKDTVVLVVDDEETLRKAIFNDFKRKGYQVLSAGNGRDAFEIVKNHKIDVILSDIKRRFGLNCPQQIQNRNQRNHPQLRAMLYSNFPNHSDNFF